MFPREDLAVKLSSLRSTTVLLAALDNSTRIHGKAFLSWYRIFMYFLELAGCQIFRVNTCHEHPATPNPSGWWFSGQLHPMIAVLSIGDCELLMLSMAQHFHFCDTLKIKDFCAESALGINETRVCYQLVGRGCTGELKLLRLFTIWFRRRTNGRQSELEAFRILSFCTMLFPLEWCGIHRE